MASVLIMGAGLGGLTTAMLLAKDRHHVTVLERDPARPSPPERAASERDIRPRPGVQRPGGVEPARSARPGHGSRRRRTAVPDARTLTRGAACRDRSNW